MRKLVLTISLLIALAGKAAATGDFGCLFPNDPEFSARTGYMSYAGILRFGNYEASGRWADRGDVERFLEVEKSINPYCREVHPFGHR